ncbi:hypothetical protein ACWEOO_21860 [Kribbella sp. NPDC004138]
MRGVVRRLGIVFLAVGAGLLGWIITLTTCQDLFHSPDRSVAFGHLVRVSSK